MGNPHLTVCFFCSPSNVNQATGTFVCNRRLAEPRKTFDSLFVGHSNHHVQNPFQLWEEFGNSRAWLDFFQEFQVQKMICLLVFLKGEPPLNVNYPFSFGNPLCVCQVGDLTKCLVCLSVLISSQPKGLPSRQSNLSICLGWDLHTGLVFSKLDVLSTSPVRGELNLLSITSGDKP